jgi:predicted ATPase
MTLDGGSSPTDGRLAVRMSDFLLALRQSEHATPEAGVAVTWLESMLRASTHILDLQPHRMREYAPGKAKTLGDSGENLSAVLKACSPSKLEDIQDWVEELCGPTVKGIRFDETQLGDVLFFLEENDGRRVSARSVSDGTLRFLGLVTAILTAPEGSVLVMEEPDTGLHPARLGVLAELLQDTAKRRKLQILATTHSSTLLAYLRPEVLGEAVALRRDPETGESRASALAAIPYFETLRDSDRIAELLSTGWLEHAQ